MLKLTQPLMTALRKRPAPFATGMWFVAYAAATITGQSFSTAYLDFGWQSVPWTVLRDDPLGSVWNLHIQPPLWNLSLGLIGKLSPFDDAVSLRVFILLIGLALVWVLALVIRDMGVPPGWAVLLTLGLTLNPDLLHHAFVPTYELAAALLLTLCVRAAQLAVGQRRGRHFVWLSVALTALVLTRSLYHPVVIVFVLVAFGWHLRRTLNRRSVIAAAVIPVLLVGGWMVKNQLMFGTATTSSWFGMNLHRSTIPILPRDEAITMYNDGDISAGALIGAFAPYDEYAEVSPPCEPEHSHPVLTIKGHVDANGEFISNFNYECYLPIYEQAGKDFWAVATAHPDIWWKGRVFSLRLTFATSTLPSTSGSPLIRLLDHAYRLPRLDLPAEVSTIGWGDPMYGEYRLPFRFSLAVAITYGLLAMYACALITQRLRRRPLPLQATAGFAATVVLAAFLGAFTIVVGAIGELGEQSRFRSMTDPICLSAGVVVGVRLLRSWLCASPDDNTARAEESTSL